MSSIRQSSPCNLNLSHLGTIRLPTKSKFLVDLKAHHTVLSANCTRKTTNAVLWALFTSDDGFVASNLESRVGSIQVLCKKKHGKNIAALSSSSSSLVSQVVPHLQGKRPLRFATVLFTPESGGTLFIGRMSWIQFASIVPKRTLPVSFVNIPMKIIPTGGYQVELTSISFRTSLTTLKAEMEMDINQRFTKLPSKIYQFLVRQIHQEAAEKKISQASTSYGNLARCYKMKAEARRSFRNITMVFGGKSQWSVTGEEFFLEKPGSGNVFCLAFLDAAAGHSGVNAADEKGCGISTG